MNEEQRMTVSLGSLNRALRVFKTVKETEAGHPCGCYFMILYRYSCASYSKTGRIFRHLAKSLLANFNFVFLLHKISVCNAGDLEKDPLRLH